MQFEWDAEKDRRNRETRGFGFRYASLIFKGRVEAWADDRMAYGELRIRAVGEVEGRVLHVVYTHRDGVCRIISARPASRKERRKWL